MHFQKLRWMYLVLECDMETVDTPNNPLDTRRKLTVHKTFRKCLPTAQKMKLSNKDFFSKCDQIHSFLRIWSHLLKKSLMELS